MSGDTLDKSKINSWVKTPQNKLGKCGVRQRVIPMSLITTKNLANALKTFPKHNPLVAKAERNRLPLWQKSRIGYKTRRATANDR